MTGFEIDPVGERQDRERLRPLLGAIRSVSENTKLGREMRAAGYRLRFLDGEGWGGNLGSAHRFS